MWSATPHLGQSALPCSSGLRRTTCVASCPVAQAPGDSLCGQLPCGLHRRRRLHEGPGDGHNEVAFLPWSVGCMLACGGEKQGARWPSCPSSRDTSPSPVSTSAGYFLTPIAEYH